MITAISWFAKSSSLHAAGARRLDADDEDPWAAGPSLAGGLRKSTGLPLKFFLKVDISFKVDMQL